jgi:hypothetical protein
VTSRLGTGKSLTFFYSVLVLLALIKSYRKVVQVVDPIH